MAEESGLFSRKTARMYGDSQASNEQITRKTECKLTYLNWRCVYWVAVQELRLNYHKKDTLQSTIYPYSGDLASVPQQQPSSEVALSKMLRFFWISSAG